MVSAVNLSIPVLAAGSLHPSAQAVLWVVDGYVVVFACLLIPTGAVADRKGRKGTLLCGLGLFTLGSAVCALAPQTGVLIGGRMLSGAGAAAVLPTTLALLVDGLPARRRPKAIAVWASMTGLAAVLGNVGGGAAIEFGTWRTIFVCIAASLPAALAGPGFPTTVAAVRARTTDPELRVAAVSAFTDALRVATLTLAVVVVLAALAVFAWLPTGRSASGTASSAA